MIFHDCLIERLERGLQHNSHVESFPISTPLPIPSPQRTGLRSLQRCWMNWKERRTVHRWTAGRRRSTAWDIQIGQFHQSEEMKWMWMMNEQVHSLPGYRRPAISWLDNSRVFALWWQSWSDSQKVWSISNTIYHMVMTNIAMENPNHKWRF